MRRFESLAGHFSLVVLAALAAPAVAEELPPGMTVASVEVQPAAVDLHHKYDYRQLLITGRLDSGELVDLTRMAVPAEASTLVSFSETGMLSPLAEGSGEFKLTVAGHAVTLPVTVQGLAAPYKPSFVREIMPAMSKLGCNAGTCHGSANGKNGFKLSLRGYDPLLDYQALTDEHAGRRFNRPAPDLSLMLIKPSGAAPHVGGVLMKPGSRDYDLLRAWIAGGVELDLDAPRVTKIEISPQGPILPLPDMKQQMAVLATYADGSVRDVTAEAFVDSSNTEVAEVDKKGLVTAVRRGEAVMLARFEGSYAASALAVMGDRSGYEWKPVPENNFVDELVYKKLQRVKLLPSDLCTDAEFIRRVYLDLVGMPPSPDEVKAFLADARETKLKRDEMIDALIGSPTYVDHWTNKWADLLQVNRKFLGDEGAWAFRNWIHQAVASNMPYNQFVHRILTASGSTLENPPAAYYKVLRVPEDAAENTTQLFLGIRFNCNKCHDHPFERWTQDQYYHMAAYFAQVGRKVDPQFKDRQIGGTAVEAPLALSEIVYDSGAGEVTHVRTGQTSPPLFPYSAEIATAEGSRRTQLADWLATKDNPYFAKSYVNRIWSYLLGLGLIEPSDDIRAGNPPSNPELLERLTQEFIDSGFDTRHVMRSIVKSRVYQHSFVPNEWNADDQINYSHALARRLPAETLYDAVQSATGSTSHLPDMPAGSRASEVPDSSVALADGFFGLFGRPPRESACECERSSDVMLSQAMNLVNGPTIAEAISNSENRITRLVNEQPDDAKLVEDLFISILCRPPTASEVETGLKAIREGENRLGGAQDLAWVLINSPAFLFNH